MTHRMTLTEIEVRVYQCLLKKHITEPFAVNWSYQSALMQRGVITSNGLALCHIFGNSESGYELGPFSKYVASCIQLDLTQVRNMGIISNDAYDICCGLLVHTDDNITLSFLKNLTKLPLIPTSKGIHIDAVKDSFS